MQKLQPKNRTETSLKAIIFDYGNVLCLPPLASHIEDMCAVLKISTHGFDELYSSYRPAYDRGDLDAHAYWTATAQLVQHNLSDQEIASLAQIDYQMWSRPNQRTFAWVQHCKDLGFQTALLSNMPADHRQYLDMHCPWLHSFDARTFSGEIRCIKPDPAIYHHSLNQLGITPPEALFLDDRIDNIGGATEVGLNAILFDDDDIDSVARQIQTRFAVQLP